MNTFKVFYLLSFWSLFLGLPVSYVIGSTEAVGSTAAGHLSGSSGKRSTDVSEQRTTVKDIQGNTGGGSGGSGTTEAQGRDGTATSPSPKVTAPSSSQDQRSGSGGANGTSASLTARTSESAASAEEAQQEASFSIHQLKVLTTMAMLASVM